MKHVTIDQFKNLSLAKAKKTALKLFDSAMQNELADWKAVSFALHAAYAPRVKPKIKNEGFEPWLDYEPTSKGIRRLVTVTFSDGWSKRVDVSCSQTGTKQKPFSIAKAVKFAIFCYRSSLARRVTGSSECLYYQIGDGLEIALDKMFSVPAISSIVADELQWNAETANSETEMIRAGIIAPHDCDNVELIEQARAQVIESLGFDSTGNKKRLRDACKATAQRVSAWLECENKPIKFYDRMDIQDVLKPIVAASPRDYPLEADAHDVYGEPVPIEPQKPFKPIVSNYRGDGWTTYKDGQKVPMEEVFPRHVVVIEGSHRAVCRQESVATVTGLKYPQSGRVVLIDDVLGKLSKGCRISGPRSMTKLYRDELARLDVCNTAARFIVLDHKGPIDRFVGPYEKGGIQILMIHTRRDMLMNALFAFGFKGDSNLPTGKLANGFESSFRLDQLMNCRAEPCKYSRQIRQDDLEHVFPPLVLVSDNEIQDQEQQLKEAA